MLPQVEASFNGDQARFCQGLRYCELGWFAYDPYMNKASTIHGASGCAKSRPPCDLQLWCTTA